MPPKSGKQAKAVDKAKQATKAKVGRSPVGPPPPWQALERCVCPRRLQRTRPLA